jgi:hypothetical protein
MTDVVQQQTAELLKALTLLHHDLLQINVAIGVCAVLLLAIFLIVAFRRI